MSLKDLTADLHHEAETTKFAQLLLSGNISKDDYRQYLYNLKPIYQTIESICSKNGYFATLHDLERTNNLSSDLLEIKDGAYNTLTPSTIEYRTYLTELGNDPARVHLIKAHVYVRHMGDLFGGQVIKRQVAHISAGRMYGFENATQLKEQIRAELTDDLGDEARVAFQYAIRLMKELGGE